jgi:hypothetical protein
MKNKEFCKYCDYYEVRRCTWHGDKKRDKDTCDKFEQRSHEDTEDVTVCPHCGVIDDSPSRNEVTGCSDCGKLYRISRNTIYTTEEV